MSEEVFEELKVVIESLTDEEKKITDFVNFDFEKLKRQYEIVKWSQDEIVKHVKQMIEGVYEDLKINEEDKKLGPIPSIPVLLKRYLDLTDDWRLFIRSRISLQNGSLEDDVFSHEIFISYLGQIDILDLDNNIKFNESNNNMIKQLYKVILEVEDVLFNK